MKRFLIIFVLVAAVLGSGVGVIFTKHANRHLFIELQNLQARRDALEVEWELLQLEQSTLATAAMVDQTARVRLNMVIPDPQTVIYITR